MGNPTTITHSTTPIEAREPERLEQRVRDLEDHVAQLQRELDLVHTFAQTVAAGAALLADPAGRDGGDDD